MCDEEGERVKSTSHDLMVAVWAKRRERKGRVVINEIYVDEVRARSLPPTHADKQEPESR